jgi:uncharacterized SAM-binding protein YcdF (DUF218 family)
MLRYTWRWAVFGSLGLALAALVSVAIYISRYDTRLRSQAPLDAAIVLGAAAYGSKPSPVFAGRLDYGFDLLHSGRVRFVIVTGGGRDDPRHPEAAVGVRYLLSRGASPQRVLAELHSIDTPQNLCFALQVGAAHGLRTYAIVSDPLHLRRAMLYARDLGMAAEPAGTPYTRFQSLHTRLGFVLRETYVYTKRLLHGPARCHK